MGNETFYCDGTTRHVAPSWLFPISYLTRANGIIIALVNSQPSVLLNFKNSVSSRPGTKICCAAASEGNDQWRLFDELMCHLSSAQKCKNTFDKHSVLLTYLLSVAKFGATRTSKPFCNITVNVVVVT